LRKRNPRNQIAEKHRHKGRDAVTRRNWPGSVDRICATVTSQ
jgi:hypothetical protein